MADPTHAEIKHCPKCKLTLPTSSFSPNRARRGDGLCAWCKPCTAAARRAHYAANRERSLATQAAYRDANRQALRTYAVNRRNANLESERERGRLSRAEVRALAVVIYGSTCVRCGASEPLEFDHVNGDGSAHRKVEDALSMLRRIARQGAPLTDVELQLLCIPCHRAKSEAERRAKLVV